MIINDLIKPVQCPLRSYEIGLLKFNNVSVLLNNTVLMMDSLMLGYILITCGTGKLFFFYFPAFNILEICLVVTIFTSSYSRSCDEMSPLLRGLLWANDTETGSGYLQHTTADSPYNVNYKIPGTVQNYLCRKLHKTLFKNYIFIITVYNW